MAAYSDSDDDRDLGARLGNFSEGSGHRTLAEKAFAMLHDAIIVGELHPGERLPISDLAEAMHLSQMPIREALRRLDADGLVENIPHRGASVASLTIEDLVEVYDSRLLLELPAIEGAAARFTAADERDAAASLDRLEDATDRGEKAQALNAHTSFHFGLYRASGSRWLPRLISPLWDNAERYRVAALGGSLGLFEARAREHRDLLAACAAHEPDRAAALLWNHLVLTANAILKEMGGEGTYELRDVPDGE
ncbi:MAG TPA: GntR family transcriptional regulator [Solirubrobacterales bacterium]|jgi:DNA-binding GntR family transcriptional regulator